MNYHSLRFQGPTFQEFKSYIKGLQGPWHELEQLTPKLLTLSYKDPMREEVHKLTEGWSTNTLILSSSTQMQEDPTFPKIVGLGWPAVPYLIEALERNWHLALALSVITGEQPVKPREAGRVVSVVSAWKNWGAEHGLRPLPSVILGVKETEDGFLEVSNIVPKGRYNRLTPSEYNFILSEFHKFVCDWQKITKFEGDCRYLKRDYASSDTLRMKANKFESEVVFEQETTPEGWEILLPTQKGSEVSWTTPLID